MLPIIISKYDVDPGCLNMDIHEVSTAPFLMLTASGMKKAVLQIAGDDIDIMQ